MLADLQATCAGSVKILKVDADDNPYLSLRFGVDSIPTLLCFAAGKLCEKLVGTASKEAVLRLLRCHGMADSGQPATGKSSMA
jgi:thioredoxin-like negative regulator of GroEL